MEFEQHEFKIDDYSSHATRKSIVSNLSSPTRSSESTSSGEASRIEPFRILENGAPNTDKIETKLSWLQSQIIGRDAEFKSPFGYRRLTYADHTASGRCLDFVENRIVTHVLPFYGNCHTSDSYVGQRTTKITQEATQYVKKCLGGRKDDVLLFCGSGSTSAIKKLQEVIGITIPSIIRENVLKCMPIKERWVVFVGPYEHHSNLLSWRQSLTEVVEIGLDDNGLLDIEALRTQLSSYHHTNRPMLGSFSACSNVTGICTDTRAISCVLHEFGAFACFDFAASGPYVEIDMRSGAMDGYDAVFLSPHKFLGGPGAPGILLMNKALYRLKSSPPSTCGGGTVDYVNGFDEKFTMYVDDIEEREDAGTPPIIGKVRAAMAFWIKDYIGCRIIEEKEHYYMKTAIERLSPNKYIEILGNENEVNRLAILSFLVYSSSNSSKIDVASNKTNSTREQLNMWKEVGNEKDKPLHGPFVAKLLNDLFGIQARGGCACAGPYGHSLLKVDETFSLSIRSAIQKGYKSVKPGWTRISFPYYMSNEEFEFILAALEFVALYGQRFLPLYHLSWTTGSWTLKKGVKQKMSHLANAQSNDFLGLEAMVQSLIPNIHTSKELEYKKSKEVVEKYVSYLGIAKKIANGLPKFPPRRKAPEDINLDLVSFRF